MPVPLATIPEMRCSEEDCAAPANAIGRGGRAWCDRHNPFGPLRLCEPCSGTGEADPDPYAFAGPCPACAGRGVTS